MTEPTPPPSGSRGPLLLAIGCLGVALVGGCGLFGALFLLGVVVAAAPPVTVEAPPAGPAEPGAPPGPDGVVTTITVADLVGSWRTGAAWTTDHVTPSGQYAGSSTSLYSTTYKLGADQRFVSSFLGVLPNGGGTIRENEDGTWALQESKLVLSKSDGKREAWWFLGYVPNPGGESKLLLLSDRYEVGPGTELYRETWGRAPK